MTFYSRRNGPSILNPKKVVSTTETTNPATWMAAVDGLLSAVLETVGSIEIRRIGTTILAEVPVIIAADATHIFDMLPAATRQRIVDASPDDELLASACRRTLDRAYGLTDAMASAASRANTGRLSLETYLVGTGIVRHDPENWQHILYQIGAEIPECEPCSLISISPAGLGLIMGAYLVGAASRAITSDDSIVFVLIDRPSAS